MSMPAGKYYIGDLCYVLHDRWEEFCDITINGCECLNGEFEFADGVKFAIYKTANGDGRYADELGNKYEVDAGLIGCILVDDITASERANVYYGNVFDFETEFEAESHNGIIHFGDVSIDTAPFEEDEDEDNSEDDEDDDYDNEDDWNEDDR